MHTIYRFLSLQCLVVSLASISTLTTVYAAPFQSDYMTLDRRAPELVTVDGKVAELGKQISSSFHTKSKVWRLNKWDGKTNPGYVIKIYNNNGKVSDKEVEGLEAVGQFVAKSNDGKKVVMKEVTGKTLAQLVAAQPHDKRSAFLDGPKGWKVKVAKAAALIAKSKGILHEDINMDNVIIDGNEDVHFVDWEHFVVRGKLRFTEDEKVILERLNMWESTGTPPGVKKSNSSGASGKKSASPRASSGRTARSRASVKKSGSPKRRRPHRREVFYY